MYEIIKNPLLLRVKKELLSRDIYFLQSQTHIPYKPKLDTSDQIKDAAAKIMKSLGDHARRVENKNCEVYFSDDYFSYKGRKVWIPNKKGFDKLEALSDECKKKLKKRIIGDDELIKKIAPRLKDIYLLSPSYGIPKKPEPKNLQDPNKVKKIIVSVYRKLKSEIRKENLTPDNVFSKHDFIEFEPNNSNKKKHPIPLRKSKNKKYPIPLHKGIQHLMNPPEVKLIVELTDIELIKYVTLLNGLYWPQGKGNSIPAQKTINNAADVRAFVAKIYSKFSNTPVPKNYYSEYKFVRITKRKRCPLPSKKGFEYLKELSDQYKRKLKKRKINNVENPTMPPEKRRKTTPQSDDHNDCNLDFLPILPFNNYDNIPTPELFEPGKFGKEQHNFEKNLFGEDLF